MAQRPPKKSDTLEIRLTYEDKQALMAKASDGGQSASEVVRLLLARYLVDLGDRVEIGQTLLSNRSRRATVAALWLGVSILGYGVALAALVVAVTKPLVPAEVGLWKLVDPSDPLSFSLGRMNPPPGARELLGWWIVPLMLGLALAAGYVGWCAGAAAIRRIGRSATHPAGQ